MAGPGFTIERLRAVGADKISAVLTKASTQFKAGDMCLMNAATGAIEQVVAGSKGTHLFVHVKTRKGLFEQVTQDLTTTLQESALACFVAGGLAILRTNLLGDAVPPVKTKACDSNSTPTSVVLTLAGSNDDYTGGTVWSPTLGEQRPITADAQAGGTKTLTVAPAFSRALTTGDTVDIVNLGPGMTAVKYNATTPHQGIDPTKTGDSGGHLKVEEVHLEATPQYVLVTLPDLE